MQVQRTFQFNLEVALNSLKVLKLFLTYKKFKQVLIDQNGVKQLIPLACFYTQQDMQKLLLNLVKEILTLGLSSEVNNDIFSLVVEVIRNSSDNLFIAETAIGILKVIADDVLPRLVTEESIDMYCVLFICLKGELDFELQLLGLFKLIKDCDENSIKLLRNSKKIENCILELLENYSIESTGSLSSNGSVYMKLKVLAEEVLGM